MPKLWAIKDVSLTVRHPVGLVADSLRKILCTLSATKPRISDGKPNDEWFNYSGTRRFTSCLDLETEWALQQYLKSINACVRHFRKRRIKGLIYIELVKHRRSTSTSLCQPICVVGIHVIPSLHLCVPRFTGIKKIFVCRVPRKRLHVHSVCFIRVWL